MRTRDHRPRRRLLAPVALLAASLLAIAGCDWGQYAFDSSNTGHDLSATAFTTASVTSLHQAWSVAGPTPLPARLAVVGSTVYAAGSSTVSSPPPGSPTPPGPVSALDTADGSVHWTVAGPVAANSCAQAYEGMGGPAVVAGKVLTLATYQGPCVASGHSGAFLQASSIDAATGAVGPPPSGYPQPPDGDPVVASDGSVYQSVGNDYSFAGTLLPTDSSVIGPSGFAFTPDPSVAYTSDGYRLSTPAVDAHHVYAVGLGGVLGTDPILFAIDRATGSELWRAVLPPVTDTSTNPIPRPPVPSVGDGRVFVASGQKLVAFDSAGQAGCTTSAGTTTCDPMWSRTLPDALSEQAPAISQHRVFVRSATQLSVFRTDDGAALWTASLGAGSGTAAELGQPSIASDVAFVGTQDGRLLAFDATGATGCSGTQVVCTPVWTDTLSGGTGPSRPVIAGNAVYISASDGSTSTVVKFVF